jgi:hypothetical protein
MLASKADHTFAAAPTSLPHQPEEEVNMLEELKPHLDRRDFMGLAAAFGLAAALPVASQAAAAEGAATDFTRWLDGIRGTQKIVLDTREPNGGMAMAWAFVYLVTAPKAYAIPESDAGVVIVLRHNAIPVALGDAAWQKYKLGQYFKIEDPDTGAPALRNPYYATMKDPFLPEMALQKLIDRGVKVAACDMAIHFYSGQIAKQLGVEHDAVKQEWNAALLPGIAHAPSGLVACQGAVSRGCTYLFAG